MPPSDPCDPAGDPFGPPPIPTEVGCLHCGQTYESYLIEWRIEPDYEGLPRGWWRCPMDGCDGKGFGFDIFPTDPEYRDERGGWSFGGDEDDDELDDEEPDPPGDEPARDADGDDRIPW